MEPRPGGLAPRALRLIEPAALALLALGIRALPRQRVFVDDDVLPFGHDAYYHLRRIVYSAARFPEFLDFDRYINYPDGAKPIWSPLFDWAVALVCRPFFAQGDVASLERAAMWVPPVLGAAAVLSVYALARRHLDLAAARGAALLLAVLPAHFWYSQVGFVDHHAAVALVSVWLLAAVMGWLDREASRASGGWGSALCTGGLLALAILVWPGCLLHVALVEAGLLAWLLTRPDVAGAEGFARRYAASQLAAAALVLPFVSAWPQWGAFSPVVLSRFQPWLFGSLGLFGVLLAAAWRLPVLGGSRQRRVRVGLLFLISVVLVGFLLMPELRRGAADAWRWLARAETFQASVGESQPLLVRGGRVELGAALSRLSGLLLGFPLALAVAFVWARRRPDRPGLRFWLFWCTGLFAATLVQRRFFNSFAPAFALLMGWALCEASRALSRRGWGRGAVCAARLALATSVLILLFPLYDTYAHHIANELRPEGAPQQIRPWLVRLRSNVEMARWIGRRTPVTSGWLDARRTPEYAVLAPWDMGHLIEYEAKRPTVTNEFGDDIGERNFELARRYYQSAEGPGSEILDRLGARYVIAPPVAGFLGEEPAAGSLFEALYFHDGSQALQPAAGAPRALERHRLVYESRAYAEGGEAVPALAKVFEHVPGATIRGRTAPRARIRLELPLRTNRGRELVYRTHVRADAEGRYALRVPYANRGGPRGVRAAEAYTLACGDESARVVVDEAAVREGRAVEGPDPCR